MTEYLHISLDPDSRKSKITFNGNMLPGVTGIRIEQVYLGGNDAELYAGLRIEMLDLCAVVLADNCSGNVDPVTEEVLKQLPCRVVASLADDIARIADELRRSQSETQEEKI